MYGYPEITPAQRAKIFGLNAARVYGISAEEVSKHTRADAIARERYAYRERPQPHYRTYGPKTRREFLNLLRWNGGRRAGALRAIVIEGGLPMIVLSNED